MNKVSGEKASGKVWDAVKCPLVPIWYVAERLGVSEKTVDRLSQLGKLPPKTKVGRLVRLDWGAVCKLYPHLSGGVA
jgi:predicted DNA-binding transcriptional regulator AlpA